MKRARDGRWPATAFRVSGGLKRLVGLVRFVSFVFCCGRIQLIRIARL